MIKKTQFSAIVAYEDTSRGIGAAGTIPWKNSLDLKFFKKVTTGHGNNAVIMGRKTFESIGRSLPGRVNLILSSTLDSCGDGYEVFNSVDAVVARCESGGFDNVFVIGGEKIYKEFLNRDLIDVLYIDEISHQGVNQNVVFDTFFPELEREFVTADFLTDRYREFSSDKNTVKVLYRKRAWQETDHDYLALLDKVIRQGIEKNSRSGEVLSDFCNVLSFDLKWGLPVLTSKKMYTRGCLTELLWFLRGETNIKFLVDNNTHIWDGDAYRFYCENVKAPISFDEFLKRVQKGDEVAFSKNGCDYKFGDLGPVYGKQWVDWCGVNQVKNVCELIKNNPNSRRIMINAWNVSDIDKMALPPCHYGAQFYVKEIDGDKYLSCTFNMRSVDVCLGLPYDILSYAVLTHLIAKITGCKVDKLNCFLGDTHVYKNQLGGVYKQLSRNPYAFDSPVVEINEVTDLRDISTDDIKINNYNSFGTVKYPLSVG